VDNRPGAGATIGHGLGAKATPDGYTIMLGTSGGLATSPALGAKLPYDPVRDFAPIGLAVYTPFLLAVYPGLPAANLKDFIALSRTQPNHISFASPGIGTPNHLGAELLKVMTGFQFVHVPYKGGGPALNAVMGGEVQIHYPAGSVGIPQVKAGRVRGLAFTGEKRLSSLPDLPTVGETVPGFVADAGWHAAFAPPGTPPAIVNRLQQAIRKALQVPLVHDNFVSNGYEPKGDAPAVWAKVYQEELKRLAEIAKAAKLEPQ